MIHLGQTWAKNGTRLIVRLCINMGKQTGYLSRRTTNASSCIKTNYAARLIAWMDDQSVCLYLYTDELSDKLPFFAQDCPRQIVHL